MHAHVVAPEAVGELTARRVQGELGPLVEGGPESLRTELLRQVPHAGQAAVLPIAQFAEELGHAAAELDRLVRADEDVDIRRHPLPVGQAPADEHVETDRPIALLRRPEPDVIDLDPGAVLQAAGHGYFELTGKVGVLPVAGEVGGDRPGHRQRVDDLLGVDARDRARAHVAGRVATGLDGREPDVPEPLPDPRHVGDADPVQLNVLPGREVGIAVAEDRALVGTLGVGVGRHPDLAHLGRRHHAAGDLDPHHEGVSTLALGVHAHPFETLLLSRHGVDGVGTLFGVGVDDRLRHLEGMAGELELLDRVQLTNIPVGAHEAEGPLPTTERHPIGIVQVSGHQLATCRPHSDLSRPAQRPARGSSPSATGRVVGAQPMER